MFDFRKSVRRHHSIDVPFHDGFSADRDRYLLRDNNDILVTSAGVRIAGLNHSSSSRQPSPKIPGLRFRSDCCPAHLCRGIRLLMKVSLNRETPEA
jgi:hypothetical protein